MGHFQNMVIFVLSVIKFKTKYASLVYYIHVHFHISIFVSVNRSKIYIKCVLYDLGCVSMIEKFINVFNCL